MPNPFAMVADDMNRPRRSGGRGYRSFGGNSSFAGGTIDRTTEDWLPWTLSPDWETRSAIRLLRGRARQLVRDNGYCSGFVGSVGDNIVGPDGIMLQPRIKTLTGQLATSTNKKIKDSFIRWGEPESASADGFDSWVDIQRIYAETMAVDGEVIIRRLPGFDNEFGYALQFIDSDLLDETYNIPAGPNRNEIRMGVEIDRWRRAVAYWIWNRYATDANGQPYERERVPASQIIHRFIRYRPNQTRGLTWFAPVMVAMHHLGHYQLNEVIASRVAAGKMGFILNKNPEAIAGWTWDAKKVKQMDVEPGVIDELMPGQEFAQFDPQHPATTYDQFEMAMLRSAGRGLRVSNLTLTGDLRQANYSSMRAGLLPERDHWRGLQKSQAMHFCRPIYRDWVGMALLSGALAVDTRLASNYYDVAWKGRGWSWVDPLKDLQALKLGIDLGVDSRQHANAEQGRDYEDVVDELQYEQEYADEADVDVSGNQIAGIAPTRVSPEGQNEDSAEPKDGEGDGSNTPPQQKPGARVGMSGGREAAAHRRLLRVMAGGQQ